MQKLDHVGCQSARDAKRRPRHLDDIGMIADGAMALDPASHLARKGHADKVGISRIWDFFQR